jgi:hypothetical protein
MSPIQSYCNRLSSLAPSYIGARSVALLGGRCITDTAGGCTGVFGFSPYNDTDLR